MAIQTATTSQLENAQNVVISKARFTMEHNAPCVQLVEHFDLKKGAKTITVPKVGQMTALDLTDGVDIVASEDIGMTTADLTTAEVGLKVILTDKLVRQENEDVFSIVGRQMGDAMARKKDPDVIALFSALNGGTVLGADNKNLSLQNAVGCVSYLTAQKAPPPYFAVHHPNAVAYTAREAAATGATYGIPVGPSDDRIKRFFRFSLNDCDFYHDGNIAKLAGYDSGYGVVASKAAMCVVESVGFNTERERDASLRGTEVVVTADYGCFELDDSYGAALQYEIGTLTTST